MVASGLIKIAAVGIIALIGFYIFNNRTARDSVSGETPDEKGAIRNTIDFLAGDGKTAQIGAGITGLDSGSQVDLRTGEQRNEKGAFRNTFDFFFGDGTSAIAATGIRMGLTSKNPPKSSMPQRRIVIDTRPRGSAGGRRFG